MRYAPWLVAPLAVLLSGCWVTLTNTHDIALYQSDVQQLIVTNTTAKPLTIVPIGGGPPAGLAPGQSMTVRFRIATVGTLHTPSGSPYWTIDPAGYTETFVEGQAPRFVDTSSTALTLNFHDANGVLVKASFSLTSCALGGGWAQPHVPTTDHPVEVPDPVPGVPQAVCP